MCVVPAVIQITVSPAPSIGDQAHGLACERQRDLRAPRLARRQLFPAALEEVADSHALDRLRRPVQAESAVEQLEVIRHRADPCQQLAIRNVEKAFGRQGSESRRRATPAEESHVPGVRPEEARDNADERRLAAAVAAEQDHYTAGSDIEGGRRQDRSPAEPFRDRIDLEDRAHRAVRAVMRSRRERRR
jgi:hypothetical protein